MSKDEFDEPQLPDHYLVYGDYWYIIDGGVEYPGFTGTVGQMKEFLMAKTVRRCDMVGRGLMKKMRGWT